MKYFHFLLLFVILMASSCGDRQNAIELTTQDLLFSLDDQGRLIQLADRSSGTDYLVRDTAVAILSIRVNGKIQAPVSAKWEEEKASLELMFPGDRKAILKMEAKETHLYLELLSLTRSEEVELVIWGPYPTSLGKQIGETVGIVQGETFAMGIQALNPKTLGGYPWQENDCMPQIDIFDQEDPSDLSETGKRYVLYRVEAAKPAAFGSTLQAYCRNRTTARVIENWGFEQYLAPPFEDGGVIGSRIALFGCPLEKTLETIGKIEIAEGLPHPMIDGEWGKMARSASAAYVILDFSEADIDKALDFTQKAGLRYLYHSGPFKNWGHFELQEKAFPNGWQGLKSCVEKADSRDIMVGAHTLSNFITTNDPYVSPEPDTRLAKVGSSELTEAISAEAGEISIVSTLFFDQLDKSSLKTVQIGQELIRVGRLEGSRLLDCQRGAWGTAATSHEAGAEISLLADHAYKVFLSNPELTQEMASTLADLYNQTGLRQISFDGLEGNRSTGMGNYGEILFTQSWYDGLNEDIRSHYIADASRTSHFFWHMYTRMNWGEPWYAGFRESQTDYRMKNQEYFQRNLMPGMLGWFSYTSETSVEDIEWMLARSAAFNAGYAFFSSYEALEQNGNTDSVLALLGRWEKARMSGAFSDAERKAMEDVKREFHLEAVGEGWKLYEVSSFKFTHENKVRQPGEPLYSTFAFENPYEEQVMGWILTAADGDLSEVKLELDNYKEIVLPVTLQAGETLRYSGGSSATVFSKTWQPLRKVVINEADFQMGKGAHSLNFDCIFKGGGEAKAKLELRVVSM